MSSLPPPEPARSPTTPTATRPVASPMLAGAGLLVGAWAVLPPYTGPVLDTAARVEFADHVVPGVVVILVSTAALLLAKRTKTGSALFAGGLAVALAGFWMTATHLPLVLQATRAQAPWGATIYHSLPGLTVLVLGVAWAANYRAPSCDDAGKGKKGGRQTPLGGSGRS